MKTVYKILSIFLKNNIKINSENIVELITWIYENKDIANEYINSFANELDESDRNLFKQMCYTHMIKADRDGISYTDILVIPIIYNFIKSFLGKELLHFSIEDFDDKVSINLGTAIGRYEIKKLNMNIETDLFFIDEISSLIGIELALSADRLYVLPKVCEHLSTNSIPDNRFPNVVIVNPVIFTRHPNIQFKASKYPSCNYRIGESNGDIIIVTPLVKESEKIIYSSKDLKVNNIKNTILGIPYLYMLYDNTLGIKIYID